MRSRYKSVAVKEEVKQETAPVSKESNEAVEAALAPQPVAGPDSSDIQTVTEESTIDSGSGSDREWVESMHPDSLAARWLLERKSVLRELHRAVVRHMVFYTSDEGGGLTMEEAIAKATKMMEGPDEYEDFMKFITTRTASAVSWLDIDRLFRYNPDAAQEFWQYFKEEADKDFKSGHFAAQIFERSDWQQDPWRRAHFIAIRESFVEQFKPQGGIDYSMIDMLAVSYAMWLHWTEEHMHRTTNQAKIAPTKKEREYLERYEGEWVPPRVKEQEAIDHAAQMADRWRRSYQATLRQMRDWRRYNVPVTINNPQQVNIAADGGQQVNVQKSRRKPED